MTELVQLAVEFSSLSLFAFGGGVAMLPELERISTVKHAWVAPTDFAQLYALGQLAPGPNGIVVLLIGYRVAGWTGALVATLAMFLPGSLLALALGRLWRRHEGSPWAKAIHRGLTPITVGLMVAGVVSLARSAVTGPLTIALATMVGMAVLTGVLNPALLVLLGGLVGWLTLG